MGSHKSLVGSFTYLLYHLEKFEMLRGIFEIKKILKSVYLFAKILRQNSTAKKNSCTQGC